MTAKRFTHKEDDWEILDNGEHFAYAHSDYQAEKICELLNELHEENQLLKLQSETKLFSRRELEKENEQLKRQDKINEDCYKELLQKYDNLKKENEELKKEVENLKQAVIRAAFDRW